MKTLEVLPAFFALAIIAGALVGAFVGTAFEVFRWISQ